MGILDFLSSDILQFRPSYGTLVLRKMTIFLFFRNFGTGLILATCKLTQVWDYKKEGPIPFQQARVHAILIKGNENMAMHRERNFLSGNCSETLVRKWNSEVMQLW